MKPELRQKTLMSWLIANFEPNKYFSIEEIVNQVKDLEDNNIYTLNTDPYKHDKCILLSTDVRELNFNADCANKIIIKDSKGGIKLCETLEEFKSWREKELKPLVRKFQYLSILKWKSKQDGTMDALDNDNIIETLIRITKEENNNGNN